MLDDVPGCSEFMVPAKLLNDSPQWLLKYSMVGVEIDFGHSSYIIEVNYSVVVLPCRLPQKPVGYLLG